MRRTLPLLLMALCGLGFWWWLPRGEDTRDEGTLTYYGNIDLRQIALAFNASGRITRLSASETEIISAGDMLGQVDTRQLELQAKAQAALVEAERQSLLDLERGPRPEEIEQAEALLAAAEASAKVAQGKHDRVALLITSRSAAATRQSLEQAAANLAKAHAAVDQSRAALALLQAGTRPVRLAAARAELAATEASLELLHYQIDQGTLRAPGDAVVRSRLREPGDMVTARTPELALALTGAKWARIYLRETVLGRITQGMPAEIHSDIQPGQLFPGRIGYIASVAEFTPPGRPDGGAAHQPRLRGPCHHRRQGGCAAPGPTRHCPPAPGRCGMSGIVVQARSLTRRFAGKGRAATVEVRDVAVKDLSFSVQGGEVTALVGPDGAGKTTTFRMLCGLLPASSGQLEVAGHDLRHARAQARARIGYVGQKFTLYSNLTVRQNLSFFGGAYGLAGRVLKQRIADIMAQFQLELDAVSGRLPAGYRQRRAMAAGLLHQPEILFLDEPTSGIDPLAQDHGSGRGRCDDRDHHPFHGRGRVL